MRFSCKKNTLNQAVQIVQKAVTAKTPMPILTGIYIAAADNKIELQATDYEIGIKCSVEAIVDEPGTVVLSGRYFQDVAKKMPGDTVSLATSSEDRTIQITSNQAKFNLLSFPPEEFPVLKEITSDTAITIKDEVLRELIRKTVFACSTDEARPIFTGCLLEIEGSEVVMVATNTHRLAIKKHMMNDFSGKIKIIIPAKILNEVARSLNYEEPLDVKIYCTKNQVVFTFDDVYMVSRLIEGQFPDYKKVVPPSFATNARLKTAEFADAVERVSLLAREGDYNIIILAFKSDSVTISSNNPDVGKACETVPAIVEGEDIEIAFNSRYVTDILRNLAGEELLFSLNTPLSSASIKSIADEDYNYILTPIRTS